MKYRADRHACQAPGYGLSLKSLGKVEVDPTLREQPLGLRPAIALAV